MQDNPVIADLEQLRTQFTGQLKRAFQPMPGGQPPPMDPAQQQAMMDPAMMGGQPPPMMDPAMMAGGGQPPPMDPAMMGGQPPPMDPAMMGGQPQPGIPPELEAALQQLASDMEGMGETAQRLEQKLNASEAERAQMAERVGVLEHQIAQLEKVLMAPPSAAESGMVADPQGIGAAPQPMMMG